MEVRLVVIVVLAGAVGLELAVEQRLDFLVTYRIFFFASVRLPALASRSACSFPAWPTYMGRPAPSFCSNIVIKNKTS